MTLEIQIPGSSSLKDKRSRLKPLLSRLHREFNISAAEIDRQNDRRSAVIGCAIVSNDAVYNQRTLQGIIQWLENNWPDLEIVDGRIDVI